MTTPIDKLREALKRIERRSLATEDITEARAALDELESQLSAQPKLEWREPSTATRFAEVLVVTIRGGFGRGRRRTNDWQVNGDAMNPGWIAGWMPLDALPPAPKGGSGG